MKKEVLNILVTLLIAVILYYLYLPAINITHYGFWIYIIIVVCIYSTLSLVNIYNLKTVVIANNRELKPPTQVKFLLGTIFLVIVGVFVVNLFNSPLFMSKKFSKRIDVLSDQTFEKDIPLVDIKNLPLLDKESSQKLGDRVMGQIPELVSQFNVSNLYTQINYKETIIRATPLEYADFFKFLSNKKEGIKGYITVNSVTGESKLIKLDKGMKYMPSGYFSKDLYRKLRFSYPTLIFDHERFEIDENGNPYWVIPYLKYSGVELRKEVAGVVVLNPINGKSEKYSVNKVPKWVDQVYPAELVLEQIDHWGLYQGGFINSIFGQKNVVATTKGYNYTIMNGDVYLYTGVTSTSSDESNIGFVLVNLRTKEAKLYKIPGAEEYSAMASAEGQVQQMKYKSTFPLLVNVNNKPTYLMSLKDNAGLVKMYALVDVVDYQKVVVTDSAKGISEAISNYLGDDKLIGDTEDTTITIKEIKMVVEKGNTNYYIKDSLNDIYLLTFNTDKRIVPFLKENDTLKIKYKQADIREILEIVK